MVTAMMVGRALLLLLFLQLSLQTSKQQNTHPTSGTLNFYYRAWTIPFQDASDQLWHDLDYGNQSEGINHRADREPSLRASRIKSERIAVQMSIVNDRNRVTREK